MLFLAIAKGYENPAVPAPQELAMIKAGLQIFKQDSRLKTLYVFAGERGGFGVWDVSSIEEFHRAIGENPMARLVSWEVHPLIGVDEALGSIGRVEQMMAQMAPSVR